MFRILSKEKLAPLTVCLQIEAPEIARKACAGQFVIIRLDETGERIPLTLADFDKEAGTITLVFQEVGKTTKKLATFSENDFLVDVAGPLGKPSEISKVGSVLCAGGGVGVAAIYPIARAFSQAGNKVIGVMGFRNIEFILFENEMREVCDELYISTDDGSHGFEGFASQLVEEILTQEKVDLAYAVGPTPMMQAVCETTRPFHVKTLVSLNPIMVDGTGMCGACRVSVGGETKFCCVDGPDFDGHQVDFNLLATRQRMYLKEEKLALEHYQTKKKGKGYWKVKS
ncbi:MAG: sulfide/dihydroorotate dehydrogenase-like FAD/NAD-binding protein [Candidatus Subteraquimicrobiales bacterium]|nr:sulfide/dihydroorotate dehydrogenase-like FAD/NAD-binding protein [Candidatus Subteraquimicrobiales bacterium]